ncbi:MAG: endonuclease VIII [Chloroflexi bacterium]|nr:endonuclease VIII [Chloroflexota bacterium]
MLEIPESQNIAKQINENLCGQTIAKIAVAVSLHNFAFFSASPQEYSQMLNGQTIDKAQAAGGFVEIFLGKMRLLLSDGVNVRYYKKGEKMPLKHQLLLEFNGGSALVCTVQLYGMLLAFRENTLDNFYYQVAKNKPSPLSHEFTWDYFIDIYNTTKPSLSAKALLATEQRIPGLGNGVSQDILFNAGINPRSKLSSLEQQDLKALYKSVQETLHKMTEQSGRDSEKDLFGIKGGYRTILSSQTWQNPCPKCATTIVRQAFLGGNIYFCPICQPFKG